MLTGCAGLPDGLNQRRRPGVTTDVSSAAAVFVVDWPPERIAITRPGDTLVLPVRQPRIARNIPEQCQHSDDTTLAPKNFIDRAGAAKDLTVLVDRVDLLHHAVVFEPGELGLDGGIMQIEHVERIRVVEGADPIDHRAAHAASAVVKNREAAGSCPADRFAGWRHRDS